MQYEHLIAFSRYPVTLVLFAVFIWQCHKSFDSWQDPKMVTVFTEEEIDSVLYPSVTFCPMRQDEAQEAEGDNLKDIYESKMEPYEKVVMMVKQANRVDETKEITYVNSSADPPINKEYPRSVARLWMGIFNNHGCYTFNPAVNASLGLAHELELRFSLEGYSFALLFVHSRQNFLMGTYRRFGFDVTKIDPSYPRGQNTKELNFLIKISKYKHYPTPDYQCQPDSADTKTLHLCQKEYYARKMNCLLPWYADSEDGSETIRPCDSPDDLQLYKQILANLTSSSPKQALKELQCPIPCEILNFKLEKVLEHSFPKGGEDPNDLVGTEMIVNDGVIEVLEEKPLYNGNDFVADVGGYLGLLLGASILTIYQDATKFLADKWRRKK